MQTPLNPAVATPPGPPAGVGYGAPSPPAAPPAACSATRSTPARSMTKISPGAMSRTYSAPTMSKAHDSDATTHVGVERPGAGGSVPSASGRNPFGSRAAISASSVRMTSENAPRHWWSASTMRATGPVSSLCAARWRMSSVSDDELKSVPRSTSRSRMDRAFERFPLWARARFPSW